MARRANQYFLFVFLFFMIGSTVLGLLLTNVMGLPSDWSNIIMQFLVFIPMLVIYVKTEKASVKECFSIKPLNWKNALLCLGIAYCSLPFISMIVVPFCSLVLSVIIAHTVLGPIGWKIGTFISDIVYAGISGSFRVVFGAIFGFVYAPLVITGLHHMSNAIDMQLIADFGGTMLWPMIALSNIAQGSAVLGMIYLQRKNAAAQEVNVPSCISCYLGVTEPAMFGVNLKFHFPFICGMIGSAIAAVVCVATSTTANAIGVGGIPGILSIQPAYMLSFALCMVIAIVVPFVLTVIVGKKKGVA